MIPIVACAILVFATPVILLRHPEFRGMSLPVALRWSSPGFAFLAVLCFNHFVHLSPLGIVLEFIVLIWWIASLRRLRTWRTSDAPFSVGLDAYPPADSPTNENVAKDINILNQL